MWYQLSYTCPIIMNILRGLRHVYNLFSNLPTKFQLKRCISNGDLLSERHYYRNTKKHTHRHKLILLPNIRWGQMKKNFIEFCLIEIWPQVWRLSNATGYIEKLLTWLLSLSSNHFFTIFFNIHRTLIKVAVTFHVTLTFIQGWSFGVSRKSQSKVVWKNNNNIEIRLNSNR